MFLAGILSGEGKICTIAANASTLCASATIINGRFKMGVRYA